MGYKTLLVSIKNKQKLHKKFFLSGNDFEKTFYKTYANKLTRVKNLSKKLFYKEAIFLKKNNPKKLLRFINAIISIKQQGYFPSSKILNNDTVIDDPIIISELFNDYLVKTGQFITNETTNLLNLDFDIHLKNRVFTTIVFSSPQPAKLFDIINIVSIPTKLVAMTTFPHMFYVLAPKF